MRRRPASRWSTATPRTPSTSPTSDARVEAVAAADLVGQANAPAVLLGAAVRARGLLTPEAVAHQRTDVLARLHGLLTGAGWRAAGARTWWCSTPRPSSTGPRTLRHDFPRGAERLYNEGRSIEVVLVNGEPVLDGGVLTDARAGELLRSGRSTETVGVPAHHRPPDGVDTETEEPR